MRLDIMDDLTEHLKAGRLRIVSKEPWVLNGKPMFRVLLEEVDASRDHVSRDAEPPTKPSVGPVC